MKQKIITILAVLTLALLLTGNADAYRKMCLTRGESVPNDIIKRFTCNSDVCELCTSDNLYPTHPGYCNNINYCTTISGETIGGGGGGSGNVSTNTNINLTIKSPLSGKIYTKRVLFDMGADRDVELYYKNGNGEWNKLTDYKQDYRSELNLAEGFYNLTIKAVDRSANIKEFNISFYVDSNKPKIKTTEPSKGYLRGTFEIVFTEKNPTSLVLKYGNFIKGYRTLDVDLSKCSVGNDYRCAFNADIDDLNGQKIYYWFVLKDITGTTIESRHLQLGVDNISPVIRNPTTLYRIDRNNVYFTVSVNETNIASVAYYDYADRMPKWKSLCTSLDKNGLCSKKITFIKGYHNLEIRAIDKAGNADFASIEFNI